MRKTNAGDDFGEGAHVGGVTDKDDLSVGEGGVVAVAQSEEAWRLGQQWNGLVQQGPLRQLSPLLLRQTLAVTRPLLLFKPATTSRLLSTTFHMF